MVGGTKLHNAFDVITFVQSSMCKEHLVHCALHKGGNYRLDSSFFGVVGAVFMGYS